MENSIKIKGARAHNLKNINVEIPRDKLVVITGLSGSGKSSLAFDTIYAEGQRRYVESLSSYARQFLGQMDKPDVDSIDGLSPAISIDQKTTSHNPRSTVGTVTEIYDYLRLLFARAGRPHCPKCGKPITQQTVDQMVDRILALPERTKLLIMAQVVRGKKGEHKKTLAHIRHEGYVRVRIDGDIYDVNEDIVLEKNKKHTIEVVVDRLVVREGIDTRLADSLETALKLGEGVVYVQVVGGDLLMFSENFACVDCGIIFQQSLRCLPCLHGARQPHGVRRGARAAGPRALRRGGRLCAALEEPALLRDVRHELAAQGGRLHAGYAVAGHRQEDAESVALRLGRDMLQVRLYEHVRRAQRIQRAVRRRDAAALAPLPRDGQRRDARVV